MVSLGNRLMMHGSACWSFELLNQQHSSFLEENMSKDRCAPEGSQKQMSRESVTLPEGCLLSGAQHQKTERDSQEVF